jgi:hypothetical protein
MRVLLAAGTSDAAMAGQLPPHGERSPSQAAVWPRPVKGIRLKLGRMPHRAPSHPRQIAGSLTVPQRAEAWGSPPPWVDDQSKRGPVVSRRAAPTRLSLGPDGPETLEAFGP